MNENFATKVDLETRFDIHTAFNYNLFGLDSKEPNSLKDVIKKIQNCFPYLGKKVIREYLLADASCVFLDNIPTDDVLSAFVSADLLSEADKKRIRNAKKERKRVRNRDSIQRRKERTSRYDVKTEEVDFDLLFYKASKANGLVKNKNRKQNKKDKKERKNKNKCDYDSPEGNLKGKFVTESFMENFPDFLLHEFPLINNELYRRIMSFLRPDVLFSNTAILTEVSVVMLVTYAAFYQCNKEKNKKKRKKKLREVHDYISRAWLAYVLFKAAVFISAVFGPTIIGKVNVLLNKWNNHVWFESSGRRAQHDFSQHSNAMGVVREHLGEDLSNIIDGFTNPGFTPEQYRDKNIFQTEALSDHLRSTRVVWDMFLSSELVGLIYEMILVMASSKFFPTSFVSGVRKHIGKPVKMSMTALVSRLLDLFTRFVEFGENCFSDGFRQTMMRASDPVSLLIRKARDLLYYKDKLYTGLPVPGGKDAVDFHLEATRMLEEFVFLQERVRFHSLDEKKLLFERSRDNIRQAIYDTESMLTGLSRPFPFGIVLYGTPGVGKSQLLNHIAKVWSATKGREYKETQMFHRIRSSDYWEGYNPLSHPFVHISELGNQSRTMALKQMDPILEELTSVMDNVPFPVNVAFEDKGKVFARPEMVLIDTNNKGFHLSDLMHSPAAIQRRFYYVQVKVKPEFCRDGSTMLDEEKSLEAGGDLMDRFQFQVFRQLPGRSEENILNTDSIRELDLFLSSHFRRHIEKQEVTSNIGVASHVYTEAGAQHDFSVSRAASYTMDVASNALKYALVTHAACTFLPSEKVHLSREVIFTKYSMCLLLLLFLIVSFFGFGRIFFAIIPFFLMTLIDYKTVLTQSIYDKVRVRLISWQALFHQRMAYLFGGNIPNPYASPIAFYAQTVIFPMFAAYAVYRILRWWGGYIQTEATTDFGSSSDNSAFLNYVENLVGCENMPHKIPSKLKPSIWNIMEPAKSLPTHSGSFDSLHHCIIPNLRRVRVSSARNSTVHCLGLASNFAVVNTHMFSGSDFPVIVEVLSGLEGSVVHSSACVTSKDVSHLGNDISVIRLKGIIFRDITCHLADFSPEVCEGQMGSKPVTLTRKEWVTYIDSITKEEKNASEVYMYHNSEHTFGLCGFPIMVSLGPKVGVFAIHMAGNTESSESYAARISKSKIMTAIQEMSDNTNLCTIVSEGVHHTQTLLPVPKSFVHYEHIPCVRYKGRLEGPVILPDKSRLRKTGFSQVQEFLRRELHADFEDPYVKPMMKAHVIKGEYVSPITVNVRKVSKKKKTLPTNVLEFVVDKLVNRLVNGLRERGVKSLSPFTFTEAVNGCANNPDYRRINVSSAAGFGFPGKKREYLPIMREEYNLVERLPTEDLQSVLKEDLETYMSGETTAPIYKMHLKDEPRESSKVNIGKTRAFYASPLNNLILSKMFLGPFYAQMFQHNELFCTAVGVNMYSDAGDIVKRLAEKSDVVYEGDFSGYDTSMPYDISLASFSVVYRVLERMGYNEEALLIVRGLITDGLHVYISVFNDLLEVAGLQASGKDRTAEDNSIKLLIIFMLLFYSHPDNFELDFFEEVCAVTNGDDSLWSKTEKVQGMTDIDMQNFACETLGMTFTSSSKSDVMGGGLPITESTFLKRNFIWKGGKWLAPLSVKSIFRGVEWTIPSSEITEREQLSGSLVSSCYEVFIHVYPCRSLYDDYLEACNKDYLNKFGDTLGLKIPSFDSMCETFELTNSGCMVTEGIPHLLRGITALTTEEEDRFLTNLQECLFKNKSLATGRNDPALCATRRSVELWHANENVMSKSDFVNSLLSVTEKRLSEIESSVTHARGVIGGGDLYYYKCKDRSKIVYKDSGKLRKAIQVLEEYNDLKVTVSALRRKAARNIFTESGDLGQDSTGAVDPVKIDNEQNVRDISGEVPDYATLTTVSMDVGQLHALSVKDFLSRPVELERFTAPVNTVTNYYQDAWDVFMLQPAVRAKLRNFSYLKASLNLKIVVTGSPFHSGRFLVSYQPFVVRNETFQNHLSNLASIGAAYDDIILTYLSQAKNCAVMNVNENKPLVMVCPFLHSKPVGRLYNTSASVLSDATSYADFSDVGYIFIHSIGQIKAASATPSPVSVQIFGWLTDVELGAPTGTQVAITTEAGDERVVGPVERISSSMLRISKLLESAPTIGPYAKASSIVLRGVGSVSSLFGWSYPVTANQPEAMVHRPFSNGAQTIGESQALRITLDPKQELTVDVSFCGTEEDEMIISSLASRPSFLNTFSWSSATAPYVTLQRYGVTPMYYSTIVPFVKTIYQPTACAFAAQPFTYWRGKMVFRFEIMCSKFHRGKLLVVYEPNVNQSALIDVDYDLNKQYSIMIDIQETQTFTVCVDWTQDRAWLLVGNNTTWLTETSTYTTIEGYSNGYLRIMPFTELTSPDGSSVDIATFVSCDDLQVQLPQGANLPTSRIFTESGDLEQHIVGTESSCFTINPVSTVDDWVCHQHFGEQPLSYRSLLKRFVTTSYSIVAANATDNSFLRLTFCIFPRPFAPYTGLYVGTRNSLFDYLRFAYLGSRGSIRKRIQINTGGEQDRMRSALVSLLAPTATSATMSTAYIAGMPQCTLIGSIRTKPSVNSALEVEIPYYSPNLFSFTCNSDDVGTQLSGESYTSWVRNYAVEIESGITTATGYCSEDTATGEDFTFIRFLGAPYFCI